jgi:hypothetical protein
MPEPCRRCQVTYPDELIEAAFQPVHVKSALRGRMHLPLKRRGGRTCYPCIRTAKDKRKGENRWVVKAKDTLRRHALSLGISVEDLTGKYGWNPDRMARDMARVYADGLGLCDECEQPYGVMGHGFADLTLDICRPGDDPYYGTNTRYICMTDNREKANMTPERWQLRKRAWVWWISHKDLPPEDLGLLF